ncbi:MAG: hypothetical protein NC336_09710 [Clostridium sp.]|nr:hypothetical protein [Clostridium sp.]
MKTKPLKITSPEFVSARKLTPLELNALKYEPRHTVITPELLEEIGRRRAAKPKGTVGG